MQVNKDVLVLFCMVMQAVSFKGCPIVFKGFLLIYSDTLQIVPITPCSKRQLQTMFDIILFDKKLNHVSNVGLHSY